jgi:hypothetical protein
MRLLTGLFLLLSVTAFVVAQDNAVAQDKQERYVESAGGFSFIIPAGWTISGVLMNAQYRVVFGVRSNYYTPTISANDEAFKGNLKDYVARAQRSLPASSKPLGYNSVKLLRQAEFATDEGPVGIKMTHAMSAGGRDFIFSRYVFDGRRGRKLTFTCAALADEVEKIEPLCDSSMKSLKSVK